MPTIDEEPYRVLYSDRPCRSNAPVNVLIGAMILKYMKAIPNDDILREKVCFDMEYRYALCCENHEGAPFSDNVLTNFRRACILNYINTGKDLVRETFDSLRDKFTQLMEIDSSLFCIDSTMVDTWARDMSRLELLYVNNELMIQAIAGFTIHKRASKTATVKSSLDILDGQLSFVDLPDADDGAEKLRAFEEERARERGEAKAMLPERLHRYLDPEARNITTYHSAEPYSERLAAVARDASALLSLCGEDPARQSLPYYATFTRILGEQCKKDGDGPYVPKGKGDGMGSGMAQSPHDTDATYREKDGEKHKGYVTGFTQSKNADDETLVMGYNVEKNNTSTRSLAQTC